MAPGRPALCAGLAALSRGHLGEADIALQAARALATRDQAAELENAAHRMRRHGYDLLAAELYHVAGHRHQRFHRWAEGELAKTHAATLGAACPTARTPLLHQHDVASLLTFRERQILLLAVEHTSTEIADRLGLALATVNNTLARAYHKLGIRGRAQLRELLLAANPGG